MILATGTRLGPYEILGPLGAGGMGEVYRAHDARLNRDVAIKVLPASFSSDPERLQRFELEARAVGQLNHPNVLTVFDVGTHDGAPYMVTELLDGETLRQRLTSAAGTDTGGQTPIGIRKALDIGRQIALGLAAAHGAGIVHRDLKPENVFVTRDGRVKILDFGLARMTESRGSDGSLPTALQVTNPGTVLGTAGYMSPEQVRGKAADARSDLFALGAVLFELVGGRRAFDRDSSADTMAAILKEDPPDLTASGVAIPPALDRLLRRCLEKNPDERFQSARDLAFAIEAVDGSSASTTISGTAAVPSRSILPSRVGLMATAAVALAAAAFGGWWFGSQRGQTAVTRWDQFAQLTDEAGEEATPRISPDGASFAYASRAKGSWDIYVQRVGGRQPIPVAADSSRHERWPAFSPDGKTIAFNETDGDGGIFIIGATGESERRLTDFGANPAWSPDGRTIVFAAEEVDMPYIRNGISSLWIVDVSGGAPRQLTKEDAVQPIFSPSGRRIAFWQAVAGQRDLVTMAADGTDRVKVTDDAPLDFAPAWSPDGRYLYFASDRGGSMGLWRVGIDESTGRAAGALESVSAGVEAWMDMPSFSADGSTLLFRSRLESVNPTAIPFDPVAERAGTPKMLVSRTGVLNPTSVSRDGLWLALCNQGEAKEDLFVMRTDGTGLRRLTDDAARDRQPRWAPDDKTLLFYSNREGHYGAWSIRSDGSGLTRLTAPTGFDLFYASLSPADGTMLITGDQGESFLATPPFPVGKDRFRKIQNIDVAGGLLQPSLWSPDGRYISGPVVARATSAPIGVGVYDVVAGKAWKLTDDGGLWSLPFLPDSKRIIYLTSASELVVVDVATGKRRVISVTLPFPVGVEAFTVAPDGRTLYYGARRVEANVWKVSGGKQ